MNRANQPEAQDAVADLARLFREHPAWRAAARRIADGSASNVYLRERPGEAWHLIRRGGETHLEPGAVDSPDFVFRFGPGSVGVLEAVHGDIGDFAVALFELVEDESPERGVDFRVVAPWLRLAARGYARLLLDAGPKVLAFGARHGVLNLGALRRVVADSRKRGRFDWETRSKR